MEETTKGLPGAPVKYDFSHLLVDGPPMVVKREELPNTGLVSVSVCAKRYAIKHGWAFRCMKTPRGDVMVIRTE